MAEQTTPQPQEQPQPSATTMIESAKQQADRLEKENARLEANIKRMEELEAMSKLGGKTSAPTQPQPEPQVDPRDYAKKALQGKL